MSLILEALKKLDREKQSPDRGLLVVGPSAWPSVRGGRSPATVVALLIGAVALAAVAAALWRLRDLRTPATAARPAAAAARTPTARTPTPAPIPTAARPPGPATPRPPATARLADTGAPTTARPTKASPAADRFLLQAISQQDGKPVAVLNDRLVREGDTFDGVRVLRIGADEVEIEVAGRRRLVKF